MKALAIIFAVCVAAIAAIVMRLAWPTKDPIALGSFVILSLTLIVLVVYAYDTNSIARVTRDRWRREGVLSTTYNMQLIGNKGDAGRTLFQLHNPSTLVVRATVNCNLKVYGTAVNAGAPYDGQENWLVFPQQMSQGWFEIESLLQQNGKTVAAMIAESTQANRKVQLTMRLELKFWDELGATRSFPARSHYFDFDRWAWIPQITEA